MDDVHNRRRCSPRFCGIGLLRHDADYIIRETRHNSYARLCLPSLKSFKVDV